MGSQKTAVVLTETTYHVIRKMGSIDVEPQKVYIEFNRTSYIIGLVKDIHNSTRSANTHNRV